MKIAKSPVAVLEIGSTGIRLLVAELQPGGLWRELDRAWRPVALGRDVFTSGVLSRESLHDCVGALKGFGEMLDSWGIERRAVHALATSAVRIARNRDIFVDRVKQAAGFNLSIIEGVEENRLMYLAVRNAIREELPLFWRANSMIIEIGGGSTEIMLLRKGKMVTAHSLNLGTILIDQRFRMNPRSQSRYINESIRSIARAFSRETGLPQVRAFFVVGSDARVASTIIGREISARCRLIKREDFIAFVEEIRGYTIEDCVSKFRIPFGESEGFVTGLTIYRLFLEETGAKEVIIPLVSIREGHLLDLVLGEMGGVEEEYFSQIIASAASLGRKYHFDEKHARHVAALSLGIFDALKKEHGMGRRDRILLEIAALLHDIGLFIQRSGHEEHSRYIINNSEIFGVDRGELEIVGNIALLHGRAHPSTRDINPSFRREERVLILKLSSILRVADALDRSHSQRIKNIGVEPRGEVAALRTQGLPDLSLELMSLEEKAGLFQDIFGYKVILT